MSSEDTFPVSSVAMRSAIMLTGATGYRLHLYQSTTVVSWHEGTPCVCLR